MLITCFQCRQQLDVPDDSAGKRVRCAHCSYVIVVPSKPSLTGSGAEETPGPVTALPSMELDSEGEAPPKPPRLAATPVPPMPLPVPKVEVPVAKTAPPVEELPPPPSIERGARRRVSLGSPPKPKTGWGTGIVIVGVLVSLVIGIVIGAIIASANRPRHFPPIVMNPPQFQQQPFNPNFNQGFNPNLNNFNPGPPPLPWQDFQNHERLFKCQFHATPVPKEMFVNQALMTGFEAREGEWFFAVLHRSLDVRDVEMMTTEARFHGVERNLIELFNLRRTWEQPRTMSGIHPGREWDFVTPAGRQIFVQTYLVKDGERHRHYVLTAEGPPDVGGRQKIDRHHNEVTRFFNSFVVLLGIEGTNTHVGQVIHDILDDTLAGGRRENEFTAIAPHPNQGIFAIGTIDGRVLVHRPNGNRELQPVSNKPIEQIVISRAGQHLAASNGDMIHIWTGWAGVGNPGRFTSLPGRRCAMTKDNRILIVARGEVKSFDLGNNQWQATLDTKDAALLGFTLAADENTLALHDDTSVALWQWREKKQLGKFDAHEEPITAIAFSPNGKTLATGSADRTIKLWDVETRTERATLKQHAWSVATLAFSPDGKRLVSGGLDGMFLVWDIEAAKPQLIWAQAHQFPVRGVAFDAVGQHCVLTCKQPVTISLKEGTQYRRQIRKIAWADIKPNPQQAEKITAQCAGLHLPTCNGNVHVSIDGRTIATTSDHFQMANFDKGVALPPQRHFTRIWDGVTGRQKNSIEASLGSVMSPDGKWLAYSPTGQSSIRVMEIASKRTSPVLWQGDNSFFPIVFFNHDSRSLWVHGKHEMIRYEMPAAKAGIKVKTALLVPQKQRIKLKEAGDNRLVALTVANDQKTFLIAVGSFDNLWKRTLYDSADGNELPMPKLAAGERSTYLRLRRNDDDHIRIDRDQVNLEDQLTGVERIIGRQGPFLFTGAIHPDRKLAASDSSEKNQALRINFWDLDERRPILSLPDTSARITNTLRFSPDGRYFSCVTSSGWTRILPTEWLLERKSLLPCEAHQVAGP